MIADGFIVSHNFREYMTEAINIYIASAYLSRNIIDIIKADLNRLPQKGGRNFKFLLNSDFHEDPNMRQVLINMLLELPNVEVRIYNGEKFFHPKLYLFEDGNNMFIAVGSFNATGGGAGQNIEAGVRSSDRLINKQAKEFFDRFWDSPDTVIGKHDPTAFYKEQKFKSGDGIIIISTGRKGVVYNTKPILREKEWIYDIFVDGHIEKFQEANLKALDVVDHYGEQDILIVSEGSVPYSEWFRNYVLEKAIDMTSNTIASFEASRTETHAYQFKPLYKLLGNENHRLLIADEVGLGKTIEAGIILKELSARTEMRNVLIIVPNALKTKWRDELRIRFQEYYDIISAHDFNVFIHDYQRSPEGVSIRAIITYDQVVSPSIRNELKTGRLLPEFDLMILDEVHHLKNEETIRHEVIRALAKNVKAMAMLSATPIQLGSYELYNILSILLPGVYSELGPTGFSAQLTLCERVNKAIQLLKLKKVDEFISVIQEIKDTRAFRRHLKFVANADAILAECSAVDDSIESGQITNLTDKLSTFNVLYQYVNRTLRKDVSLNFADRNINTIEYEYTEAESQIYEKILSLCKQKSEMHGSTSAFSQIIPERRAASSLHAMVKSVKAETWSEWETDNQNASDDAEE